MQPSIFFVMQIIFVSVLVLVRENIIAIKQRRFVFQAVQSQWRLCVQNDSWSHAGYCAAFFNAFLVRRAGCSRTMHSYNNVNRAVFIRSLLDLHADTLP